MPTLSYWTFCTPKFKNKSIFFLFIFLINCSYKGTWILESSSVRWMCTSQCNFFLPLKIFNTWIVNVIWFIKMSFRILSECDSYEQVTSMLLVFKMCSHVLTLMQPLLFTKKVRRWNQALNLAAKFYYHCKFLVSYPRSRFLAVSFHVLPLYCIWGLNYRIDVGNVIIGSCCLCI